MRRSVITQTILVSLLVAAFTLGCSQKEKLGAVSGKVTFKGQPLTEGVVIFTNAAKGIHMTAKLDEQGCYKVVMAKGEGLPPGDYQVSVNPPTVEVPMGPARTAAPMPVYPNIPMKYRNSKTSGLKLTVTEEGNTLDIDM